VSPPRILLVAKPWRGGLADYLYRALHECFGARVRWTGSSPHGFAERARYRTARTAWQAETIGRINDASRDAALFVNLPAGAHRIAAHPGNVLWLTDAPHPLADELTPFARIHVSDPGHADVVSAVAGASRFAGTVPFACDPLLHVPVPGEPVRDVCFIGNRDSKRDSHLATLLQTGARTTVVGNYFARHRLFWRHPTSFRPRVAPCRMGQVYARHRLSLNVHATVVRGGTNMRTFECAAFGIPQLVEHRPGLEALFEPQREIATYRDVDDLAQRLEAVLADAAGRRAMAERARRRALAEHTYAHRLRALLDGLITGRPRAGGTTQGCIPAHADLYGR
jgi:hypothetical protein